MQLKDILTEIEKDKLNFFVKDKVMFEAVKKVVLHSVYFDGRITKDGIADPMKNFALAVVAKHSGANSSNEAIGAELRASLAGVQILEEGFKELEKFEVVKPELRVTRNTSR